MKQVWALGFALILAAAFGGPFVVPANPAADSNPKEKVSPKAPIKAYEFSLNEVRLLDGPFHDAMLRDQMYLLSLDLDRLLYNFRVTAGLPSSAKPLGGWEEPEAIVNGKVTGSE